MEEQTSLESQEIAVQYETILRLYADSLLRVTAGSVRGMVTIDEMIIVPFTKFLEALSEMVKIYPDGLEKTRLVKQLMTLHNAFSMGGYEKYISNYKQLENHYLEKYNQTSSVLSALCSLALDNTDDNAYKIISEYKNS